MNDTVNVASREIIGRSYWDNRDVTPEQYVFVDGSRGDAFRRWTGIWIVYLVFPN
jgi:hypothetical protein